MKPIFWILLPLSLLFPSCLSVKFSPAKQTIDADFNLKNQKILIVTHDTELSQEYLIYLKNHSRLLLEDKKSIVQSINVRYATTVTPQSVRNAPYILFENTVASYQTQDKIRLKKSQTVPRFPFEEDLKTLADILTTFQPDVILKIDVLHERRRAYFTLDNSYQELKEALFQIHLKATNGSKTYMQGEIFIEHLTKMDMLSTAKKTAAEIIKQFNKNLIIR